MNNYTLLWSQSAQYHYCYQTIPTNDSSEIFVYRKQAVYKENPEILDKDIDQMYVLINVEVSTIYKGKATIKKTKENDQVWNLEMGKNSKCKVKLTFICKNEGAVPPQCEDLQPTRYKLNSPALIRDQSWKRNSVATVPSSNTTSRDGEERWFEYDIDTTAIWCETLLKKYATDFLTRDKNISNPERIKIYIKYDNNSIQIRPCACLHGLEPNDITKCKMNRADRIELPYQISFYSPTLTKVNNYIIEKIIIKNNSNKKIFIKSICKTLDIAKTGG